jgi:hypothetical protein
MNSLWLFVSKPKNQKILSWIGSGVVIVAGGLWAVVTFLWTPSHKGEPPSVITQTTSGPNSPTVSNVHGDVTINSGERKSNP